MSLKQAGIGQVRMKRAARRIYDLENRRSRGFISHPRQRGRASPRCLPLLYRHGVPWCVLGRGSNTLVSDKGVRGAVIKLGDGFDEIRSKAIR